jgi:hypothetical protein
LPMERAKGALMMSAKAFAARIACLVRAEPTAPDAGHVAQMYGCNKLLMLAEALLVCLYAISSRTCARSIMVLSVGGTLFWTSRLLLLSVSAKTWLALSTCAVTRSRSRSWSRYEMHPQGPEDAGSHVVAWGNIRNPVSAISEIHAVHKCLRA